MERQLPEGELCLRRCMALCVRLQRLHDFHRILQPSPHKIRKLSEGELCLQIMEAQEDRLQSLCNLCVQPEVSVGCKRRCAVLLMGGSSLCAQVQFKISQCAPATAEESRERVAIEDMDARLIRHETAGDLGRGLGGHNCLDACSSEATPNPNHIKGGSKPPASGWKCG